MKILAVDIDLEDYPEREFIFYRLYALTKAGIISFVRESTSRKNFHAILTEEIDLAIQDQHYPALCNWKGIVTLTKERWVYFWCGKECRRKAGEASEWFTFDELTLANYLSEELRKE